MIEEDEEFAYGISDEADDEDKVWDVKRILGEDAKRYKVEWADIDPKTGKPWAPSWVKKSDCTPGLIAHWKEEKKRTTESRKRKQSISARSNSTATPRRSPEKRSDMRETRSNAKAGPSKVQTPRRTRAQTPESEDDEDQFQNAVDQLEEGLGQPSPKRRKVEAKGRMSAEITSLKKTRSASALGSRTSRSTVSLPSKGKAKETAASSDTEEEVDMSDKEIKATSELLRKPSRGSFGPKSAQAKRLQHLVASPRPTPTQPKADYLRPPPSSGGKPREESTSDREGSIPFPPLGSKRKRAAVSAEDGEMKFKKPLPPKSRSIVTVDIPRRSPSLVADKSKRLHATKKPSLRPSAGTDDEVFIGSSKEPQASSRLTHRPATEKGGISPTPPPAPRITPQKERLVLDSLPTQQTATATMESSHSAADQPKSNEDLDVWDQQVVDPEDEWAIPPVDTHDSSADIAADESHDHLQPPVDELAEDEVVEPIEPDVPTEEPRRSQVSNDSGVSIVPDSQASKAQTSQREPLSSIEERIDSLSKSTANRPADDLKERMKPADPSKPLGPVQNISPNKFKQTVLEAEMVNSSQIVASNGSVPGNENPGEESALEATQASEKTDYTGSQIRQRDWKSVGYKEAIAPAKPRLSMTEFFSSRAGGDRARSVPNPDTTKNTAEKSATSSKLKEVSRNTEPPELSEVNVTSIVPKSPYVLGQVNPGPMNSRAAELEFLKSKVVALEQDVKQLKAEKVDLDGQLQALEVSKSNAESELEYVRERYQVTNSKATEIGAENTELSTKNKRLEAENQRLLEQNKTAAAQVRATLEAQIVELRHEVLRHKATSNILLEQSRRTGIRLGADDSGVELMLTGDEFRKRAADWVPLKRDRDALEAANLRLENELETRDQVFAVIESETDEAIKQRDEALLRVKELEIQLADLRRDQDVIVPAVQEAVALQQSIGQTLPSSQQVFTPSAGENDEVYPCPWVGTDDKPCGKPFPSRPAIQHHVLTYHIAEEPLPDTPPIPTSSDPSNTTHSLSNPITGLS